jgi:hypothetical protein
MFPKNIWARWCFIAACLFYLVALAAAGPQGSLRLTAYPDAVVADGNGIVTISAEVRGRDGKPVPDGTQVAFNTTLGTFRLGVVGTEGGVARTELIASQLPGVAVITASALGLGLVDERQVLFAKDNAELQASTDYLDVGGADYLAYAVDLRVIGASGRPRKAVVHYRFITIEADDLQVNTDRLVVKARNALFRYGPVEREYDELYYALSSGQGQAVAQRDGQWQVFNLRGAQEEPVKEGVSPDRFQFADLSLTELLIKASYIWLYPNEKVQFRQAEFYVGEVKAFSLALYSYNVWGANGGAVDSLLGVQSGQVYLNLPYYYELTPKQTGALWLRTAQRSGRGFSSSGGWFLDLEHEYRHKHGARGSFQISSLTRGDWGINWRHYQPLDNSSRLYVWLDSPTHSGLFGSMQISRQFHGFNTGLTVAGSRLWRGSDARSYRTDLYLETTPRLVAHFPVRHSLSLNGSYASTSGIGSTNVRRGVGIRSRWNMNPLMFGRDMTLTGGLTVGQFFGDLNNKGWELTGTLGMTQALGRFGSMNLTYDYSQDPLGASLLGRHRITGSLLGGDGKRIYASVYLTRALDKEVSSLLGDLSYRMGPSWRLGFGLTFNTFQGFVYRDYTYTLGYQLGYRELAITWSQATRRWSFDILNTTF